MKTPSVMARRSCAAIPAEPRLGVGGTVMLPMPELPGARRLTPISDRIRSSGKNRIDGGTLWCHDCRCLGQAVGPCKQNWRADSTKRSKHHQNFLRERLAMLSLA